MASNEIRTNLSPPLAGVVNDEDKTVWMIADPKSTELETLARSSWTVTTTAEAERMLDAALDLIAERTTGTVRTQKGRPLVVLIDETPALLPSANSALRAKVKDLLKLGCRAGVYTRLSSGENG